MNHPTRFLAYACAGAAAALGATSTARAAISNPVSVTLSAPGGVVGDTTPLNLVNSPVNPATGINPGDGSAIGSFMLSTEFIHFSGNSILVDIASGDVNNLNQLITGYLGLNGAHAQYRFANLSVAGSTITGFTGSVTGLTSPTTLASFITLTSANSLTIDLDSLILAPVAGGGQSDALGVVTINLVTQPVPEPVSWALMLAGGACLLCVRRGASRRI